MQDAGYSRTVLTWCVAVSTLAFVGASLHQAFHCAPTNDELAHLAAGVAMIKTGEPGFYRVNPPLHSLVSGAAVVTACRPSLPDLVYLPAGFQSGDRQEFEFAGSFLNANAANYKRLFIVGRLVRIPLVLLAAWMLYRMCGKESPQAGWIAAVLFLTSPMTLGHGWLIMADAIAAVMTVGLLKATIEWLCVRDIASFTVVGLVWGLALGTKFTFCPLFVVWPIGLVLAEAVAGRWNWRDVCRLPLAHLGQGVIAWAIVVGLYNGAQLFVPLDEHGFRSQTMSRVAEPFGRLPSPLPKQFLVGIDEQTLDLERGIPSYVLGTWYPDGIHWYYAVGMLIKEQLAFFFLGIVALVAIGVATWRLPLARSRKTSASDDASVRGRRCAGLGLFTFTAIFTLLSANSAMALNVRYLLPALPAIYLVIGILVAGLLRTYPKMHVPMVWVTALLVVGEFGFNFPHHFAYVNPLFGGSYRVPPALHDSNFDGGQDIWLIEKWLNTHPPEDGVKRYVCLHSPLPIEAVDIDINAPSWGILRRVIKSRVDKDVAREQPSGATNVEIIVMRGLGVPAPWTRLLGGVPSAPSEELKALLMLPPDEWITPTTVIYRSP